MMTTTVLTRLAVRSVFFAAIFTLLPNHVSAQPSNTPDVHAVQVAMKNVMYHFSEHIAVHIIRLQGQLTPTNPSDIVIFDDKNSFTLVLASAEIAISCESLAEVLNENVFSSPNAPIKNLSIESKNNQLIIRGKLHQKGDISFETTGALSADSDGRIRLHAEHVKAAHLPVKGLLDLLGVDLARLVNTNAVHGVTVEKDDLILDPEQILPPPHIRGKVTSVRLRGNDIVQVFGKPQPSNFTVQQSGNYMAFGRGELRFGKLTMHDADLIMIDMDPRDPFDFYLEHYQEQLVAGYTKSTQEFGLRVHTRDYDKLKNHSESQPRKQLSGR
jgi:hypothetical protein